MTVHDVTVAMVTLICNNCVQRERPVESNKRLHGRPRGGSTVHFFCAETHKLANFVYFL